MSDSIRLDTSGLKWLGADLGRVAGRTVPAVIAVVERGAVNVKKDWQGRWQGLAHAPFLAASVSYDMKVGVGRISAEIGPDKNKRQGALGNIVEFGTPKNAPHPGGGPALRVEAPKFAKALGKAAGKAVE